MILICFGTRPEFIKVKSLIHNIPNIRTCFTGQHKDLLSDIDVDYRLEMTDHISTNRLNNIICNILKHTYIFKDIEYVLVQGDTSSACAMAISAFNNGVKVIHLEAGLRSKDNKDPFPEEMNRQIIGRIADIHLCPTKQNVNNLINEKVGGKIFQVGNTGLDNINKNGCVYDNKVLITLHRRDNHDIMGKWFTEIENIAKKYTEIEFIIPLHPNPKVQKHKHLFNKVKVIEPMSHKSLIEYVKKCKFVISDRTTERPESLGKHSILCNSPEKLSTIVDNIYYDYVIDEPCPYGNGDSWKIIDQLLTDLD